MASSPHRSITTVLFWSLHHCITTGSTGTTGGGSASCLAPLAGSGVAGHRFPWLYVRCARCKGSRHPVAVVAWHLVLCRGGGRRPACLACLVALARCATPNSVRCLSLRQLVVPLQWLLPLPGAFASRFTGRLRGTRGGQPRAGFMVPLARPHSGRSAGVAPRRTRSGARSRVPPAGSLRRRSWAACAAVFWRMWTRVLMRLVSPTVRHSTGDSDRSARVLSVDVDASPFGSEDAMPVPGRVCVCLLFLAGSGGQASRAHSGAAHLSCCRSCPLLCFLRPLRAGFALLLCGFLLFAGAPPSLAHLRLPPFGLRVPFWCVFFSFPCFGFLFGGFCLPGTTPPSVFFSGLRFPALHSLLPFFRPSPPLALSFFFCCFSCLCPLPPPHPAPFPPYGASFPHPGGVGGASLRFATPLLLAAPVVVCPAVWSLCRVCAFVRATGCVARVLLGAVLLRCSCCVLCLLSVCCCMCCLWCPQPAPALVATFAWSSLSSRSVVPCVRAVVPPLFCAGALPLCCFVPASRAPWCCPLPCCGASCAAGSPLPPPGLSLLVSCGVLCRVVSRPPVRSGVCVPLCPVRAGACAGFAGSRAAPRPAVGGSSRCCDVARCVVVVLCRVAGAVCCLLLVSFGRAPCCCSRFLALPRFLLCCSTVCGVVRTVVCVRCVQPCWSSCVWPFGVLVCCVGCFVACCRALLFAGGSFWPRALPCVPCCLVCCVWRSDPPGGRSCGLLSGAWLCCVLLCYGLVSCCCVVLCLWLVFLVALPSRSLLLWAGSVRGVVCCAVVCLVALYSVVGFVVVLLSPVAVSPVLAPCLRVWCCVALWCLLCVVCFVSFCCAPCLRRVALCHAPVPFDSRLAPGFAAFFSVSVCASGCLMLSSGGLFPRWCPCPAAREAALLFGVFAWFAAVSCSPVLCPVVFSCRVVLRCWTLLSCFLCCWFLSYALP